MATRVCSECDVRLPASASPLQKTCSASCRAKRSRRMKREASERGKARAYTPEQKAIADAVNGQITDVAHEQLTRQLEPVVREALTDDVLKAVGKMVGLTTKMVDALAQDLNSPDEKIRQTAYTLGFKYTMGNPSVAPKGAEQQPAAMVVQFQMPRPGDSIPGTAPLEASAIELKECSECSTQKPEGDFVAGSDRCQQCHDELQARVNERFG